MSPKNGAGPRGGAGRALAAALGALRSPAAKWAFLVVAIGSMAWFVVANRRSIIDTLASASPGGIGLALAATVLFVACTLLSWRAVLADLGHSLGAGTAIALFGISQLGKYIPGGVWNIAAAAQLGRAHGIPAQLSVAAMAVSILVSLVSGVAVGGAAFLVAPSPLMGGWSWIMVVGAAMLVLLAPPVMNLIVALAARVLRNPALAVRVSTRGILAASGWAIAGWLLAGTGVALIAVEIGASADATTVVQGIGGYALGWVGGFLVLFAPAGVGVREVIIAGAFAGTLPTAGVAALVIVSRLLVTVVDLLLAGIGAVAAVQRRRAER